MTPFEPVLAIQSAHKVSSNTVREPPVRNRDALQPHAYRSMYAQSRDPKCSKRTESPSEYFSQSGSAFQSASTTMSAPAPSPLLTEASSLVARPEGDEPDIDLRPQERLARQSTLHSSSSSLSSYVQHPLAFARDESLDPRQDRMVSTRATRSNRDYQDEWQGDFFTDHGVKARLEHQQITPSSLAIDIERQRESPPTSWTNLGPAFGSEPRPPTLSHKFSLASSFVSNRSTSTTSCNAEENARLPHATTMYNLGQIANELSSTTSISDSGSSMASTSRSRKTNWKTGVRRALGRSLNHRSSQSVPRANVGGGHDEDGDIAHAGTAGGLRHRLAAKFGRENPELEVEKETEARRIQNQGHSREQDRTRTSDFGSESETCQVQGDRQVLVSVVPRVNNTDVNSGLRAKTSSLRVRFENPVPWQSVTDRDQVEGQVNNPTFHRTSSSDLTIQSPSVDARSALTGPRRHEQGPMRRPREGQCRAREPHCAGTE